MIYFFPFRAISLLKWIISRVCGVAREKSSTRPRLSLGKYGTNFATNRHKDKLETTGVDIVQLLLLVSSISDYFTSKCLQLVHSQLPKRILRMIELYSPRELLEPEQRCVNYSDSKRKYFQHRISKSLKTRGFL